MNAVLHAAGIQLRMDHPTRSREDWREGDEFLMTEKSREFAGKWDGGLFDGWNCRRNDKDNVDETQSPLILESRYILAVQLLT